MINYTQQTIDNRLNDILDRISLSGIKSLKKEEMIFLQSYSVGNESEIHSILSEKENEKIFISDDGNFMFKLYTIDFDDDVKYIAGSLTVPDMILKGKKVKGELEGSIMIFNDNRIAIDFNNGTYDIFDFISGLEYELDCFIDDLVIQIIHEEKK